MNILNLIANMTNNQQNIIRKIQWIIYPIIAIVVIESFGVLALMQQYFTKELFKSKNALDEMDAIDKSKAANAKLLMKVEAPKQVGVSLLLLVVAIGFSVLLNIILFSPQSIFDLTQLTQFTILEKIFFGLFYLIAHFLVIVFGQRLFKGMPPLFIATEKGFYYEPAGIGSGWILWEDIAEVSASYAPLLQQVVKFGQKFHNYQTEGTGDILLRPSDFGDDYEKVLTLFKTRQLIKLK
ncbi:MAG: hypothetical protein C0446_07215 [Chitinophaga sp.]|nr:hypothetical protein [Chitinophaga sp.]